MTGCCEGEWVRFGEKRLASDWIGTGSHFSRKVYGVQYIGLYLTLGARMRRNHNNVARNSEAQQDFDRWHPEQYQTDRVTESRLVMSNEAR